MRKTMNVLLAGTLAGCTVVPAESGKADIPKRSKTPPAATAVNAVVEYDMDNRGKRIGVFTYKDPWTPGEVGSFGSGDTVGAICQQEGRHLIDNNVPANVPKIDTHTWVRFANSEWSPINYFNLGGAVLPQCAELNLAVPQP